jgi:hypothetical protein
MQTNSQTKFKNTIEKKHINKIYIQNDSINKIYAINRYWFRVQVLMRVGRDGDIRDMRMG